MNVVLILYQNYQDTVLNRSRHLYLPVVLVCSLIKIVNTASLNESPILAIRPYGLNFISLTTRNLYVVLLIGNTITLILQYLTDFLERQCRQNQNIYLMGDFNIDMLKYETCCKQCKVFQCSQWLISRLESMVIQQL